MLRIQVPAPTTESTGFNRHDERHTFLKGHESDAITVAIIEHYQEVRSRFGGELGAVRAYLQETDNTAPDGDDVADAAFYCYADYLTNNPEDQALYDQDVNGIQEHVLDFIEESRIVGDPFHILDEFTDEDGEINVARYDLEDRVESLKCNYARLVDQLTGEEYYFSI